MTWYEDVDVIGEVHAGEMWSYDDFGVFRVPGPKGGKGQLYVGNVSGCSCGEGWNDLGSVEDLQPVTPAQAHVKLNEWAASEYTDAAAGDVADLHLKISQL